MFRSRKIMRGRHQFSPLLMTITDARASLKHFTYASLTGSKHITVMPDLRDELIRVMQMLGEFQSLHYLLDRKSITDLDSDPYLHGVKQEMNKVSGMLTATMTTLMESNDICSIVNPENNMLLGDLLFSISLTLADLNPVNDIDFATQEPILPENKIVTSDRFQHDIYSLSTWIQHKGTNPWTNLEFSARDLVYIKARCINSNITDNHVRNESQQAGPVLTSSDRSTHSSLDFIINILTPINSRFGFFCKIDNEAMKRKMDVATLKGFRQQTPP